MTWVRGHNEIEARTKVKKDYGPSTTYQYTWIPPTTPESDWDIGGLAKFADPAKIEFQRLGFAQIGGLSKKRGSYPANLSKKVQQWAEGLRFYVLRPPAQLPYRGVRGGRETESLRVEEHDVVDGRVRAIILDGTPIVPVIAADQQTAGFFRAATTLGLDHSGVVMVGNIDEFRWLKPDQIEMVDGPFAKFVKDTQQHPERYKRIIDQFPKGNDPGDPSDQLEWDRYKGQWRQKKVR
jgi:hypothetical protein